jgi:hypothetical protein
VHSSTSPNSTLEWLNINQAQSSNNHSKQASINDPCLGQVSISTSDLQQAVQEAEQYQQQRQQFYSPHSPDTAGAGCAGTDKCVLQLSLPLYGTVAGKDSAAGKHAAASSSHGTAAAAAQDSLAELIAEAAPYPAASSVTGGVANSKAPLPTASKKHFQQQCQQAMVVYNPSTGTSSGTQGRTEVGELFVDVTMRVEQLLQPQDATAVAAVTHTPVRGLLEALEAQGQQLHLPEPLARAAAVVEGRASASSCTTSSQAVRAAADGAAAGAAAAHYDAAVQLVAAVWKLWQLGTLADAAAECEAAVTSAAAAGSFDGRAAAVPAGHRAHMRATADSIALSTDCSWTLPAVHYDSSRHSSASCDGSMLQHHSGKHALPGSKAGGRRSTSACVLVGSSANSSVCSSACTSMAGCEGLLSADGSAEAPYMSRYQHRQQQQQPSRLQQSTAVPALEVFRSSSRSSCPAWEQVLQLQLRAGALQAPHKEAQHGPGPTAESVLQLLSLQHSSAAVLAGSGDDSSRSSTVLPSLYHLQLLSDAAVIGGLR